MYRTAAASSDAIPRYWLPNITADLSLVDAAIDYPSSINRCVVNTIVTLIATTNKTSGGK